MLVQFVPSTDGKHLEVDVRRGWNKGSKDQEVGIGVRTSSPSLIFPIFL
jgi:hypothetical protein